LKWSTVLRHPVITPRDLRCYLSWCSQHRLDPLAARRSSSPCDFALIAMLGLLGLRIFEATSADIADLGEERGECPFCRLSARWLRICKRRNKALCQLRVCLAVAFTSEVPARVTSAREARSLRFPAADE
jgi:hypothetical protein